MSSKNHFAILSDASVGIANKKRVSKQRANKKQVTEPTTTWRDICKTQCTVSKPTMRWLNAKKKSEKFEICIKCRKEPNGNYHPTGHGTFTCEACEESDYSDEYNSHNDSSDY
jgi:hypothetical protein